MEKHHFPFWDLAMVHKEAQCQACKGSHERYRPTISGAIAIIQCKGYGEIILGY